MLLFTSAQLAGLPSASSGAPSTVRINAGGTAQTVNGTTWAGCTAVNACNGYVKGGFQWTQQPAPNVSGYPSNTNALMHQTEWTGGQTNGVAFGATAFSFNIPVEANNAYDVTLQFTELNKFKAATRVFDVKLEGTTQLSYFDIWQQAGGAHKTVTRTFRINKADSTVNIDFIRRTENAKVDAIAVVPVGSTTPPTTSSPTSSSSTTTTTAPINTTTTTAPPQAGTNVNWTAIANPPYRSVEASGGIIGNKLYQFGGYLPETGFYKPSTRTSAYDTTTNTWSSIAPIPRGLTHSPRVIDGRRFILMGGVAAQGNSEISGIRTVFTYDVDSNQWGNLPDLPAARGSGGAALIGRNVHFFGGVDENRIEKGDHWVLDLDNTAAGWQVATPFPTLRSHFAAVVVNGNSIYTVGGMTGWEASAVEKSDMYKYDSNTRAWTRLKDMPAARSHIGESTVVINGRIWMFGGEPAYPQASRDIFVYDVNSNTWQKSTSLLPQARVSGVGGNIGNTVFYVSGSMYADGAWKGTVPS